MGRDADQLSPPPWPYLAALGRGAHSAIPTLLTFPLLVQLSLLTNSRCGPSLAGAGRPRRPGEQQLRAARNRGTWARPPAAEITAGCSTFNSAWGACASAQQRTCRQRLPPFSPAARLSFTTSATCSLARRRHQRRGALLRRSWAGRGRLALG
ncbi:MAG: hypothetical protein WKG07_15410 [Hymenobacter sp.]